MTELDALKRLSAGLGADPLLVQAAGGNTSWKQDGTMWIKASGTWLRDAASREIFVAVDHARIMAGLAAGDPACETCTAFVRQDIGPPGLRPSIETTVHALMPQPVVLHVHCVSTIAWAIRADAEEQLARRLAGFHWAWIPYVRPGLPLARAIAERLQPETDVLILGNHGLVVAAASVEEAGHLLNRAVAALSIVPRPSPAPDLTALAAIGPGFHPAGDPETHALALLPDILERGGNRVFYPDHVVFLGTTIATSPGIATPLVAVPGKGVVIADDAKPAVEALGRCLADVMRRLDPAVALKPLSESEVGSLLNWDAEKFRQQLPGPSH